ncbi:hypothetical protein JHW43_003560 [Diplocarpon mali]|nr:hypothetical protein JHW43_003560 [Diplocarpon mali]
MDLRSIINTDGDSSRHKQAAPVTPIQTFPQQAFPDYSQPPQPHILTASGKHKYSSQDYDGALPSAGGPISYASPTQYHQQSFQGRPPQPPPTQPPPQNDLRSPRRSFSVQSQSQSPYLLAHSSATSQYPFPQHQTPQSPAQHHQSQSPAQHRPSQSPAQHHPYPPHFQQRDSYSHSNQPIHPQHQNSFPQQSPTPQTPPIGLPGATHPYLHHQRSASSVSTETPTSANSQQQQYFNQYSQDSPVSAGPYPPSQTPHHRQASQQSQPGTALGPPVSQRQLSVAFTQPPSPYQQRGISSGPLTQSQQTSPKPPAPQSIPRLPSTPSAYDSQRTSLSEERRRSHSERDRSVSVSPKTRLASQARGETTTPQLEKEYNHSAKRKLDDCEMAVEEPRRMDSRDTRPQVNGNHHVPSPSPQPPPKKRNRYTEPPIWAQSIRNKPIQAGGRGPMKVNGKPPQAKQPVHTPQTQTNGSQPPHPATVHGKTHPSALLGPWEASITGVKPVEQVTKLVADFLYLNVISRGDLGELASRGVEIEIEAKLGHVIDKETSDRYRLPVSSECVLMNTNRVRFESSMTESQHRSLNAFLNLKLRDAHPSNPVAVSTGRVEIKYKHSREVDSFYELPKAMYGVIPPALREKIPSNHAVKVRVTHDQKTREVKAKIIKARICDLDILNPQTPLDCRISINFEMRFDGNVEDLGSSSGSERNKDRLSYTQSMYQIDLTQVTQQGVSTGGASQISKEHELEIELSTAAVQEQGQKAVNGEPNEYLSLVEGFMDNMRVLSRATPAP